MPHAPTANPPKPADQETVSSPTIPAPEETGKAETVADQIARFSPRDRKAIELLRMAMRLRDEQAEEEEKRRLKDENFMIATAARSLTGLPLASNPAEQRDLIKHHLQEFFAALPLPPGLDEPSREALRYEALMMFLKLGPQDDVERMMLIQLICSHMASMTCFARASAAETSPQLAAQAMNQTQKMSRLFLEIERAFRQRRKQLGRPERHDAQIDPKYVVRYVLFLLAGEGIVLDDEDASA